MSRTTGIQGARACTRVHATRGTSIRITCTSLSLAIYPSGGESQEKRAKRRLYSPARQWAVYTDCATTPSGALSTTRSCPFAARLSQSSPAGCRRGCTDAVPLHALSFSFSHPHPHTLATTMHKPDLDPSSPISIIFSQFLLASTHSCLDLFFSFVSYKHARASSTVSFDMSRTVTQIPNYRRLNARLCKIKRFRAPGQNRWLLMRVLATIRDRTLHKSITRAGMLARITFLCNIVRAS